MSDKFQHLFSVAALGPSWKEMPYPTEARQYGIQRPHGGAPEVFGDQSWVRYGADLESSGEPGVIVERDVRISYGPWRPVDTGPDGDALARDVDLVHNFLVTGVGDPHGNVLGVEGDVITLKAPGRVLRITVARA